MVDLMLVGVVHHVCLVLFRVKHLSCALQYLKKACISFAFRVLGFGR